MSQRYDPSRYSLLVEWSDEDRLYLATVPELPGCRTHGTTRREALRKGEERIVEWLAIAAERGWGLPVPRVFNGWSNAAPTPATGTVRHGTSVATASAIEHVEASGETTMKSHRHP